MTDRIPGQIGRCLCGAVSFVAAVKPDVHVCHCGNCRRSSGGPEFGVDGGTDAMFTGAEHIATYRSSDWAVRAFCSRCGSGLFFQLDADGNFGFHAGLFDDQSIFRLTEEIFVDEQPEWYALAGDRPRKTGAEIVAEFEASQGGSGP